MNLAKTKKSKSFNIFLEHVCFWTLKHPWKIVMAVYEIFHVVLQNICNVTVF